MKIITTHFYFESQRKTGITIIGGCCPFLNIEFQNERVFWKNYFFNYGFNSFDHLIGYFHKYPKNNSNGTCFIILDFLILWDMKNYYKYWADRYVKDGLRFIKTIIGIGLSVSFGIQSFPIGLMFFGWVLVETLIEKK